MNSRQTDVAIIYRFLPRWRVDFFCALKDALASHNIRLQLYYGKNPSQPVGRQAKHRLKWGDEVDLDWATAIPNQLWNLGDHELVWQKIPRAAFDADLLILMQENRLLSNYAAGLKRVLRGRKVALWGHGLNHQADKLSLGNRFKRLYSARAAWWFAYTQEVADHLSQIGFPRERITIVNNALDTHALIQEAKTVTTPQLDDLRAELGLGPGPVGIYCGAMYADKNIEFLTRACDRIRDLVPGFQMLFLGAGVDAPIVRKFAEGKSWVHYVGPRYGSSRVPYFLLSDIFLLPGAVGLVVLDCFALETPLVTTRNPRHGPEIAYLDSGHDGIVTGTSIDAYTSAVADILRSRESLSRLKLGCRERLSSIPSRTWWRISLKECKMLSPLNRQALSSKPVAVSTGANPGDGQERADSLSSVNSLQKNNNSAAPRLAVCILTRARQAGLTRALEGIAMQRVDAHDFSRIRVIVIDNDHHQSGRSVWERLRPTYPWELEYFVEPVAGIPQARNRALDVSLPADDLIVFFDDDQVPWPTWLAELIKVWRTYSADVVFGPVRPYFPKPAPRWIERGGSSNANPVLPAVPAPPAALAMSSFPLASCVNRASDSMRATGSAAVRIMLSLTGCTRPAIE